MVAGALLLAGFVAWERRASAPMLPLQFFRERTFALTNVASFLMFFGMFGSIFLLAQFFQTVQHMSPLAAGLRILPWTAMPIFIAPIAGALSDRIGGQRLMTVGLTLQAGGLMWLAAVQSPTVPYSDLVVPFILSGAGMALFFAPVANVVLSSVAPKHEGKASGATNAIRLGLRPGGRVPDGRDLHERNVDRGLDRWRGGRARSGRSCVHPAESSPRRSCAGGARARRGCLTVDVQRPTCARYSARLRGSGVSRFRIGGSPVTGW
jgi:hypothetical protein